MYKTQMKAAKNGVITEQMKAVAEKEYRTPEEIRELVAKGQVVICGNKLHKCVEPAGIGDTPLTIVISCTEGSELDAGLAVQNMSAEAQLLGYGTKIMIAPTMALNNDEYKEMLSVPEGQKIAAVLIVGKAATEKDNPDAVSSATTRNAFDDMVTIISK